MKNSLEGFKSKSEWAEKRISELRTIEIIKSEEKKEKTEEKQTEPNGPGDTIKQNNIRTTHQRSPRRRETERGRENRRNNG